MVLRRATARIVSSTEGAVRQGASLLSSGVVPVLAVQETKARGGFGCKGLVTRVGYQGLGFRDYLLGFRTV
jgi:hypothetical protein